MHPVLRDLRDFIKKHALLIRKIRSYRKPCNRISDEDKKFFTDNLWRLPYLSYKVREYHIAYSELRGTPRDKIEKPREDNYPNESNILKIKKEILDKINEQTICSNT